MASPLIALRGATVAHADGLPPALHDVSLTVDPGDWIALSGGNGSGKTTLLAVLGGVLPLRSGQMDRAPNTRIALLLQEPDNQLVASSVQRELALSVPVDVDETTRRRRIHAAIERFELGALLDRNPHRLSGGEKQRLALATVWLESPGVLLLDEPLSYLDRDMRERVVVFAREMNANGVALVWATPGGEELALAKRAVHLRDGRVTGAPASSPGTRPGPERARRRAAGGTERLRFDSVGFGYDGLQVLDGISFTVNTGECAGVTGRNGSGKSTLLLLAGGALEPLRGRIVRNTAEHGVLYLPQSPERLFFAETVLEEVSFGLERRGLSRVVAHERARAAMTRAALSPDEFATRSPFELSFGEMRRVAFAIAFALEPELLLLDEPASCLDLDGIAVLDDLVAYCTATEGGSVMIATHEEPAGSNFDRIVDLNNPDLLQNRAG